MNLFVIDASAWVEYFDGTEAGERVKDIVENKTNSIWTNIITLAELASHFRRKQVSFEEAKRVLCSLSSIYQLSLDFVEEAGTLHAMIKKERSNMSLADVIVLCTARQMGGKIVTGDQDFKCLREALLIK